MVGSRGISLTAFKYDAQKKVDFIESTFKKNNISTAYHYIYIVIFIDTVEQLDTSKLTKFMIRFTDFFKTNFHRLLQLACDIS